MTNPETLQAVAQLQQAMGTLGQQGLMPGMGGMFGTPSATIPTASGAPAANTNPEERFRSQLQQLNDMGFTDTQRNIACLQATNGNVSLAVERLLLQ